MRWLTLLLIAACRNPAKGLGELDADLERLADHPTLAHLADAIDDDATVLDLFDEALDVGSAPDPTDLFAASHADHAGLPDAAGEPLRVLTFNTGLLSRRYVVFKVEVPEIDARRERMAAELFGGGWDVLFLQEVWEMDDARALVEAGEAAGYRVFWGEKRKLHRETGLVTAVRASLVDDAEEVDHWQYRAQWGAENFPGPNIKRGAQHIAFTHAATGDAVHLLNTHLTPFYTKWLTRNLQVRELGLAIADIDPGALVLVGGDFNAGWYTPRDVWTDATGEEHPGWWRNPAMPALLAYYGGLDDLANLARPFDEVAANADLGTADATWLDVPYGDASRCDPPNDVWTATDCNGHYFASYGATELPARMDLLWMRDGTGRARARTRALAFVEPLAFDAGAFELSDHYGQEVELTF